MGTPGADVLVGTDGWDVISGGGGADVIFSGKGEDLICADAGADRIHSGRGSDEVHGGPGADTIIDHHPARYGDHVLAGPGDDYVSVGTRRAKGREYVHLGGGDDRFESGDPAHDLASDTVAGDKGSDTISTGAGRDVLNGGPGRDRLRGGPGGDTFLLTGDGDNVWGGGGEAGFDHPDTANYNRADGAVRVDLSTGIGRLQGHLRRDRITHVPGARGSLDGDVLIGVLSAGSYLRGGEGDDKLVGHGHRDFLRGGRDDDLVDAGGGNDLAWLGSGDDTIDAGPGYDEVLGMAGRDICVHAERHPGCEVFSFP